jgi:elongation factor P--(R)-beta-lysine ligase
MITGDQLTTLLTLRRNLRRSARNFFDGRGYLEVETPVVVPMPGTEVHLGYLPTVWQDFRGTDHGGYLRSSPELHMKIAMARGARKIYQMGPCFRGGGELARWHHPEFLMLEWYEADLGYEGLMRQTVELLRSTADWIGREHTGMVRFAVPREVRSFTVREAFRDFAQVDLIDGDPELAARVQGKVASVRKDDDFETAFFKILLERIEPQFAELGMVILRDYPASQAALAKVAGDVAERFEIFARGVEICNGFHELTDHDATLSRLAATARRRESMGEPVPNVDPAFMAAMAQGLPPCAGNALGLDRWLAVLLGFSDLDHVLPFREDVFPARPDR